MQEIVFRDGTRTVPDHVEAMLIDSGIETWKYTYRQAMDKANEHVLHDRLARVQRDLLRDHFKVVP
jgi:hypothetical protein